MVRIQAGEPTYGIRTRVSKFHDSYGDSPSSNGNGSLVHGVVSGENRFESNGVSMARDSEPHLSDGRIDPDIQSKPLAYCCPSLNGKIMFDFKLTKDQITKFIEWSSKHEDAYGGAIGGRYTFSFTPTSLGLVTKVKDDISGEEIDLTDYNMW